MKKHKYGTCPECGSEIIYYLGLDECCSKDTRDHTHYLGNMPRKELEYACNKSLRKQGYRYVHKYSAKDLAKMKDEMCWRQKGKK